MPDQQGQLDSLCGVYVIINAVNLIYEMRRQDRVLLFKELLTTLKKDRYLNIAIMSGTYKRHMNLMLSTAKQLIYRQHKVTIKVEPLFKAYKGVDAKLFYQKLEEFLKHKNRAVIINLPSKKHTNISSCHTNGRELWSLCVTHEIEPQGMYAKQEAD